MHAHVHVPGISVAGGGAGGAGGGVAGLEVS